MQAHRPEAGFDGGAVESFLFFQLGGQCVKALSMSFDRVDGPFLDLEQKVAQGSVHHAGGSFADLARLGDLAPEEGVFLAFSGVHWADFF